MSYKRDSRLSFITIGCVIICDLIFEFCCARLAEHPGFFAGHRLSSRLHFGGGAFKKDHQRPAVQQHSRGEGCKGHRTKDI